jgi:hypothetical protein
MFSVFCYVMLSTNLHSDNIPEAFPFYIRICGILTPRVIIIRCGRGDQLLKHHCYVPFTAISFKMRYVNHTWMKIAH